MKEIEQMEALEKAALLEAIAKILKANKSIGSYVNIRNAATDAAVKILQSIK
jgi:hypothetical protein